MNNEPIWISAKKALAKLQAHYGGSAATKLELADLLRDGKLRCRAKVIWFTEASSGSRAWLEGPVGDLMHDTEIAPAVWRSSKRWDQDRTAWRWMPAQFSVTRRLKPKRQQMLKGVQFLESEINQLLKDAKPSTPRAGIGGAPAKIAARDKIWIAAMQMMHDGSLTKFNSKQELIKALQAVTDDAMSEKPIRGMVDLIAASFCYNIK